MTDKKSKTLKVAAIQQSYKGTKKDTLLYSAQQIRAAANNGAELVVLQELFASEYFCQIEDAQHFDLAEPLEGETCQLISKLAAELNIVIVAPIFEKRAPGIYHNSCIVLDKQQGLVGFYRKMHIPDDPGFYEKYYFTPGEDESKEQSNAIGFQPVKTSVGSLGILICWDQWFPEAARLMALRGAEILIYPTAIGWDKADNKDEQLRQLDAWQTIQRGHSIANNLPVISVNRTGFEPDPSQQTSGIEFWGESFITGHQGEFLARSQQQECSLIVEIDLNKCEQVRRIWPYFRDRRIDAYDKITQRFID